MIHFREDYNRIQDPSGKIPSDEPVFLLRGQDKLMPEVLELYIKLCNKNGLTEMASVISKGLEMVKEWQASVFSKLPDLPANEIKVEVNE